MNSAIIVAAGQGIRMGGAVSKQYLPLAGVPILSRTLMVFAQSTLFEEIILVVAADDVDYCRLHIIDDPKIAHITQVIAGGGERQESVFNGLKASRGQDDDLVLIHDGVRPLVEEDCLKRCLDAARSHGACIAALPSSDTMKQVASDDRVIGTLPRVGIWMAQTPQGFRLDLIREAHYLARQEGFAGTDDAQLVERLGRMVAIVPGSRANLKITTPDDLWLAEAIWQHRLVDGNPA